MNKSILIRLTGISILLAAVFYAVVIVYFGKEEKSAENRTIGTRLYSDGKFLETYMDVYKKNMGYIPLQNRVFLHWLKNRPSEKYRIIIKVLYLKNLSFSIHGEIHTGLCLIPRAGTAY